MPSTYAQFKLGQEIKEMVPPDEKKVIEEYPELFLIGLHGPDILFYYRPLTSNKVNRIGYGMHERAGKEFFEKAAAVAKAHGGDEAYLSYIYGFICHFALDVTCHGYIDEKIKESGVSHAEIEVEFDRQLMVEDGLDPIHQKLTGHIKASEVNAFIIKDFFESVTDSQVKKALKGMIFNNKLLDVGNSAFTLLVSTIMPIYFNYLAGNAGLSDVDYLSYWGYAASISTLIVALLGPICGTLADTKGYKKPIFTVALVVGAIGCVSLGLAKQWLIFLIIYIIAKVGYSGSLIFYDSMLSDITTEERMDHVSSQGFAWGYVGSCVPFIACLGLVLGADYIGISMTTAMMISFIIIALWWVLMSLPLFKHYQQKNYVEREKHAFFFYIDGVYTIIDMATAYGSALGLNSTGLLLALLVTQIVAFPFAILFGRLAGKF